MNSWIVGWETKKTSLDNRGNLIMDYLLENSIELILRFLSMLIM